MCARRFFYCFSLDRICARVTVLVTLHTFSPPLAAGLAVSLHTLEPAWPCYTLKSL